MKKFYRVVLILAVAFVTTGISCGGNGGVINGPFRVTIFAQSLPITKTLVWDANPPGDMVTNYTVKYDNQIIGNPVTTSQLFTVDTAGTHRLTVSATNAWGTSTDTFIDINVVIPLAPRNLRVQ